MRARALAVLALLGCLGLAPLAAHAQRLDIERPPAQPPAPGATTPAEPGERRRAGPDRPGFVAPLSVETPTTRAGVAGWPAPTPQVGPGVTRGADPNGVLGFGLAVEWGRPGGRGMAAN